MQLDNYDLILYGAQKINDHQPLSDESRDLVLSVLGEQLNISGSFDDAVHGHADSLSAAAEAEDMERVLQHYRIVQQGFVNCHAAFKNQIRTARLEKKKMEKMIDAYKFK